MAANVVLALGPGSKLDSLSNFASSYRSVRKNISDLLVWPFLENMRAYQIPSSTATNYKSLRDLVVDGNSRFASLCIQDVGLARQVISYAATLQPIIEAVDVATYATSIRDIVKHYADSGRTTSKETAAFFTQFSSFIDALNSQTSAMADQLDRLDEQIASESSNLQDEDIGNHFYGIFKAVFNLATNLPDAEVQMAVLLGITIDTIRGSFSALFEDQTRLKRVIAALKSTRSNITALKTLFSALKGGLSVVITDSSSLIGVWDDVITRLDTVAGVERSATSEEVGLLVSAWNKASGDADAYIAAINSPVSSAFAVRGAKVLAETPQVPVTKHEIRVHRILAKADARGHLCTRIRTNPAFRRQFVRKQATRIKLASFAALGADGSDEEAVTKVIGPPLDSQTTLTELSDNTGQIIAQFDKLLQVPFIEKLACTDPDDGTTQTNISAMVTKFRERYLALQLETLPIARNLQSYATLQIAILPSVSPNPTTDPAKISLKDFLDMNAGITKDYHDQAEALFNKSATFRNSWENAINSVTKSINECQKHIDSWNETVDQLTEQQKNATLYGALELVGALVCFAIPILGPISIFGGGALLFFAIKELIAANKLTEAINDLKGQIAAAMDTMAKLNVVIPFMKTVAGSLTNVTKIWSTIVDSLGRVDTFYAALSTPAGPVLWAKLLPKVTTNWQVVEDSCAAYINIVATSG